MPRRKKEQTAAIQATADFIVNVLDSEPWEERMKTAAYCRQCPARQGGVLDGNDIDHLCGYCPLRPYMMALAELTLRSRSRHDKADQ